MSGCIVDGCASKSRLRRGYCSMHYRRVLRYGDPSIVNPKRAKRDPVECIIPFCSELDYANKMCKRHAGSAYNMTIESIIVVMARSSDYCEICKRYFGRRRLVLDHDHAIGQARGLICKSCNTGLGYFSDNTHALVSASEYVRKYSNDNVQEG